MLVPLLAKAQYDPSFSHYFYMPTSFNPAAAGKEAQLNVIGAYAMDLAGFEHNPQTMYLAADMPFYALKSYHGVGLQLLGDKLGAMTHQRLAGQYAFQFRMLGGKMAVGLQVGLLSEKVDASRLDPAESNDPALVGGNGSGVDFGVGLYYLHGPWYLGASAQHINAPHIEFTSTGELQIDATYYLTGGYNIRLRNPFLTVKPSVLLRSDGVGYRADVTTRLVYIHEKRMLYGGISYSPTISVTALVGGSFHGIVLGYSYEYYTNGISAGNGSHELFVGYKTDINLAKKGHTRHQSVRIL